MKHVVTPLEGTQRGATPLFRQKPSPLTTATDPATELDEGIGVLQGIGEGVARCLQPGGAGPHAADVRERGVKRGG